jgi:hypothetical protein
MYTYFSQTAVTHATLENWQYMDVVRTAADPKCSAHLVDFVSTIDSVLTNAPEIFKIGFKSLFGLQDLEHDDDFVSVLMVCFCSHSCACGGPTRLFFPFWAVRFPSSGGKINVGIQSLEARCSMSSAKVWTSLWEEACQQSHPYW